MTTTPFPGTDEFNQVWTRAYFHAEEVIGTQHLLRGMTWVPRIAEVLDACDVTPLVLRAVVDQETPEPGSVDRMLSVTVRPTPFSNAAAAALDRCQAQPSLAAGAERDPKDVLLSILGDSQCRAVAVLTECGVDVEELRVALREGRLPVRPDPLPVDLRRTRDALLGRTRYRPQTRGITGWLQRVALRLSDDNLARQPVFWVRLEADELARRRGRRMTSDDVLLALLTTHEVALAYPHLVRSVQHKYRGGQLLLAAGVDHGRVSAAIDSADLGRDAVPLPVAMGDWPQDTGQILERLVCVPGNRSARLLKALGVTRADLEVLC